MAAKYGRTAGGNWSADATWSTTSGGAADTVAPTAADDVFLDANSGNVTLDTGAARACRSINCTGYTGTLTHNASTAWNIGDGIAGASNIALKFVSGMTYSVGSVNTSTINFISTSATQQTINFAGKTCGPTVWNATSNGSWQLTGAFACGSTNTNSTLTKGSLDFNGQIVSFTYAFNSNNTNTRSLTLGSATISCAGASVTSWNCSTTTGMTFSGAGATITLSGASASFGGGIGNSYGTVNLTGATAATYASGNATTLTRTGGNLSITESATVGTITFQGESVARTITGTAGKTLTVTTFNVNGSSGKVMSIVSSVGGSAFTISKASGVVSCDYLSLTDQTATGGASFYAGANSTNVSGNSGWNFTAAPTVSVTGGSLRDMERQFYSQLVSSGYGTIEDLKAKYFISQVGGANPHDAERKFLQSKGATGNSLSEMWNSYLDSRGIAGKLSDKLKKFYMGYTFS